MRYKVETKYGYASFDEKDKHKAMQLFEQEGVRLFKCKDIHDEGLLLQGPPVIEDLRLTNQLEN